MVEPLPSGGYGFMGLEKAPYSSEIRSEALAQFKRLAETSR